MSSLSLSLIIVISILDKQCNGHRTVVRVSWFSGLKLNNWKIVYRSPPKSTLTPTPLPLLSTPNRPINWVNWRWYRIKILQNCYHQFTARSVKDLGMKIFHDSVSWPRISGTLHHCWIEAIHKYTAISFIWVITIENHNPLMTMMSDNLRAGLSGLWMDGWMDGDTLQDSRILQNSQQQKLESEWRKSLQDCDFSTSKRRREPAGLLRN